MKLKVLWFCKQVHIYGLQFGLAGTIISGLLSSLQKGLSINTDILRSITTDEIDTYDRDGVIPLSGLFSAGWIDLISQGLDANCKKPTECSRIWDRDDAGRTMFYDSQAWQGIDEYRQFIFNSPCARIAGQLMRSSQINFYFDAVFIRSPGTQFSTPWHQDEPYWSVEGYNTCTIWMPLEPVKKAFSNAFERCV